MTVASGALAALGFIALAFSVQPAAAATTYNPKIVPSDFTTKITNPYFSLPIGSKFESEGETEDGLEEIEITIPGTTKVLMGVTTLVYRDVVHIDGVLVEDTKDYLAQDKEGNVWYFGEDVNNYENGKLKDHHGSWLAGVDGALPGIWMKAKPKVGETYRQEYYKGEAEDTAKVLSITETVKVPAGTFKNCLKTLDHNPLDPVGTDEHKYYCPEVKGFALEVGVESGERIELVKATFGKGGASDDVHEDDDVNDDDDEDEDDEANDDEDSGIAALQAKLISLLQQLITLLRK